MKYLGFALLLTLAACRGRAPEEEPLFTLVPAEESGVRFENRLEEREGLNIMDYEYFANGGGVAIGDLNNDGLPDLYFTANMGPNALYLNRGGFRFDDITQSAGVAGRPGWDTGVTMADVSGDGLLDIYVCRSGNVRGELRRNELFINNGDLTFTEQAEAYGLADSSYSTHATFFDYDRDGDLDVFLVNHSIRRLSNFDAEIMRMLRDPLSGDRLYRNDGGKFIDVSEQAGIIANPLGFGLSAAVGDIDLDGWPDLYVANDYIEDDYLYINNADGTFSERKLDFLTATSYSSMGVDIADFNNDALPDLVTLDMLPETAERQKLLDGPADFQEYEQFIREGFYPQFMRNMLHLNNGAGRFSEIGRMAGVSNTDWSWAPLLADFDNDGLKDLFVTTGYMRDATHTDFWQHTIPQITRQAREQGRKPGVMELVEQMPASAFHNYLFRNRGDLTFEPVSGAWGIDRAALSNGAAYGDLDADGDLDLVVNNVNQAAFLYRNEAEDRAGNHFLRIKLEGDGLNRFGVGAKVWLRTPDGRTMYQELIPARGFQSSVEPLLLFGLGSAEQADVEVTWPDGRRQSIPGVPSGQTVTLLQREAAAGDVPPVVSGQSPFLAMADNLGIDFVHSEDPYVDFERQRLLPHLLSRYGPALAQGDVNRDGLEDVYLGGAHGQPGALYFQQADGRFRRVPAPDFEAHAAFEDEDALFFDADADADLDLFVVSGGGLEEVDGGLFQDRLYLNNGFGAFTYHPELLPPMQTGGGVVAAGDYDTDGDQDLFVGGRVRPGGYPFPARSYLLENTGGRFLDVTPRASKALLEPGLISAAAWADVTGDSRPELIIAGAWMPIRIFSGGTDGTFKEITKAAGFEESNGLWNSLQAVDLDNDGDLDLVAGNAGRNGTIRASRSEPATLHAGDFDGDGRTEAIPSYYVQGRSHPAVYRDELLAQLPALRQRFPTYTSFANATIDDILAGTRRPNAQVLSAYELETSLFENRGDGSFVRRALPTEAQIAPVMDILVRDFNGDGTLDLLLAGNQFGTRAQWGPDDAGRGLFLRGAPGLAFTAQGPMVSGFLAPGDVRRLAVVERRQGSVLLVARNNAEVILHSIR